jgi:hypothetical protein
MGTTVPKKKLINRFRLSRKRNLTLLVVTDLDPAVDTIAVVKSFKRDYGIVNIEAFKVALTIEQVRRFNLQPSMDAKEKSPGYNKFVGEMDLHRISQWLPPDSVEGSQSTVAGCPT